MKSVATLSLSLLVSLSTFVPSASAATVGVLDRSLILDSRPFPLWGIRVASASQTQPLTDQLIANLDDYRAHGVNAVSLFYMGSLGLHTDPFSPDGTQIDPGHQARMEQIVRACDRRGMVAIVGIFYQRSPRPELRDWAAVENAVRTVAAALRPHRNVILNIANEQNSQNYKGLPWERVREPAALLDLCRIAKLADPARLVGAGGYDHANNEIIGASPHVDVLLYDTKDPVERDLDLHQRFRAAGVHKPMVNIELFGGWTMQWQPPGVYPGHAKAPHLAAIDDVAAAQARGEGLYISFHSSPWLQGTATPKPREPMRFDLGGQGTPEAPGMRWFFEHVRAKTTTSSPPAPTARPQAQFEPEPGTQAWRCEVEAAPAVSQWRLEREHAGFSGDGYLAWRGPHVKHQPGTAILSYGLRVTEPGDYRMSIRTRRDIEGAPRANDQVNDVFVRMDRGPWVKVSHKTPWGQWGEMKHFSFETGLKDALFPLTSASEYRFEIAARSDNVKIDSIRFVRVAQTTDPATPAPAGKK